MSLSLAAAAAHSQSASPPSLYLVLTERDLFFLGSLSLSLSYTKKLNTNSLVSSNVAGWGLGGVRRRPAHGALAY